MPQSLSRVLIHLVFSTKNREPFIVPDRRDETFAYLAGTLNAIDCPALIVGGVADHVHMLFGLSRTLSVSKVVEEVKKESSKWAKAHVHPGFYWQNGYGAFSVSPSMVVQVTAYIANQERRHLKQSFQDEFRALCGGTGSSGTSGTCGIEARGGGVAALQAAFRSMPVTQGVALG